MVAKPEQHLPPTAEDDPESAKALSPQRHVCQYSLGFRTTVISEKPGFALCGRFLDLHSLSNWPMAMLENRLRGWGCGLEGTKPWDSSPASYALVGSFF